jgi:hypothetical protein
MSIPLARPAKAESERQFSQRSAGASCVGLNIVRGPDPTNSQRGNRLRKVRAAHELSEPGLADAKEEHQLRHGDDGRPRSHEATLATCHSDLLVQCTSRTEPERVRMMSQNARGGLT